MKHNRAKLREASGAASGRGRGIAIKGFKNGAEFGGRVRYITNPDKGGEIIFSNCPPTDMVNIMRVAARRRPDITKPVGHISISLPPRVHSKNEREWGQIVESLLGEIGLDDGYPMVCARHLDKQHDHVHIVFSRVSVEGRVHDQKNLGLRFQAAEKVIEDKFNLQLFPRGEMAIRVTKNEIEMASRTGKLPPRLEIKNALEAALTDMPSIPQLVERLALAGVNTRINKSVETGRVHGLSFEYEGIPFPASKIGKEYGWKRLQERIAYEQQDSSNQQNAEPGKAESPAGHDASGAGRKSESNLHQRVAATVAGTEERTAVPTPEETRGHGGSFEFENRKLDRRIWIRDHHIPANGGVRHHEAPVKVHNEGFETPAWFLPGESWPVAIGIEEGGITFPDHSRLTDDQLGELIRTVGNPVVLFGDKEYLERACRICDELGINYEIEQPKQGTEEIPVEQEEDHPAIGMGV